MTGPRGQFEPARSADDELPPELLAVIEALAEAQARRDYARRYPKQEAQP